MMPLATLSTSFVTRLLRVWTLQELEMKTSPMLGVALRHDLPRPYHAPLLGSGKIDGYDEWRALMSSAFKIGRLSGIDVKVRWTFFGYQASGSLLGALPVTDNGELVGMLTIEDIGHARLLSQPKGR